MAGHKPSAKPSALLRAIDGFKRYIAYAAIFSFFLNVLTLAIPLYSIQIYDRVLYSGSGSTLLLLTVAVAGTLAAAAVIEILRARLLVALGIQFDTRLALPAFARLLDIRSGGNPQQSRLMRDLDNVRHFMTGGAMLAFFDLPWIPIFVIACFLLHPLLGAVTVCGAVLVIGLTIINQIMVAHPLSASADYADKSYRFSEALCQKAETVDAMGMLPGLTARWHKLHSRSMAMQSIASDRNATAAGFMKFLRYALQVAVMAVGAWLAVEREISGGALFAASLLCTRAIQPVDQIVSVWRQIVSGHEAYLRVDEALSAEPQHKSIALPRPEGRLTVSELTYTIENARSPTLAGVSFALEPGDAVGVVGPSGGGKSTFARLVVGVLKPTHGSIRIDGAETCTWEREHFGSFVGYLPQHVDLFDGTIAENIGRFRPTDSTAIINAAKLAGVHEMILSLPDGYSTVLSGSGIPLSGGQRQRVALARAVYGDPKLVVLDEPNSNLDGEGEVALLTMISSLKDRGTTVLMIAHRPSMLATLDHILVLARGAAAEFGPIERVMPRIAPGYPVVKTRAVARA